MALRTQNTGVGTTVGGNTEIAVTLTGVVAGDVLVVMTGERDGAAAPTISDSVNGSWSASKTKAVTVGRVALWIFQNSAGGNPTVTITYAGTGRVCDANVSAFDGIATAGGFDTTGEATSSTATSHANGSITPSAAALILATSVLSADGGTLGGLASGFVALNRSTGSGITGRRAYLYKLAHTGATTSPFTTTNSVSADHVCGAVLEAAGGGGTQNLFYRRGR